MATENNTPLRVETAPDGKKWMFTAGGGWEEIPLMQHERTTIKPTTLERVGKGVDDVTSGIKQGLLYFGDDDKRKSFTQAKDRENAYYDKAMNESGHKGIDWARTGGQAGVLTPLGVLPSGERAATQALSGAVQGAGAGAALYTPENKSKTAQVLGGVLGGSVGNVAANKLLNSTGAIVNIIRNGFNKLKSSIFPEEKIVLKLGESGLDVGNLPANIRTNIIDDARKQLKLTGKLDVDAIGRKSQAESIGFKDDFGMTTGQATRDPTLWTRERNLAKTEDGLPILGRLKNQNNRLRNEVRYTLPQSKIKGDDVGESIYTSVNQKWREMQDQVGKIYKQADNEFQGYAIRGMPDLEERLIVMGDDATATPIIDSVLKRGKRIGLFGEEIKDVSLKNVEQYRKFINNLGDKNEPSLMRLKKQIIDMLDDDIINGMGSDVYSVARDKARQRFQEFETKLVKNIVDGKSTPDKLFETVLKSPRNEVEALKYSLKKSHVEGQEAIGADTWDAIRSETLDWIWNKASQTEVFSGQAFKKAIEKIGDKKLKILFDGDELKQLYDIKDVSLNLTREPAFGSTNYSNTAPTIYNALSRIPAMGKYIGDAAKQRSVEVGVNRSMSGAPAVKLTNEEFMSNMNAIMNKHPLGKGLLTSPNLAIGAGSLLGVQGSGLLTK